MTVHAALRTASRGLRTNLGRSVLTVLGITIGIAAVVLIVALGQGARELILSEVRGVGANAIVIRPGRQPEGPTDIAETILGDSLKRRDIEALRRPENVPGVQSVEPAVLVPGTVSYRESVYRPVIFGWTGEALGEIFRIFPEEGAYFTEDDVRRRAAVAVLGARVREELFGDSRAVGETIKVRGKNIRVVGVLPPRGQVSVLNVDEIVLLPYSMAQRDLLGITHFHEVFVRAEKTAPVEDVADQIRATLRELHGITDPDKDDFFVVTQQDILERVGTVTRVLTIFLVAIAAISLLVGGVGIMNIMLVTVTERTSEIGLRKAVGATNRDILQQFLLEALLLTVSGGVVGTILSLLASAVVAVVVRRNFGLPWTFQFPLIAILLGVGMATAVGFVFGLYPARKAARKHPIESLRHE